MRHSLPLIPVMNCDRSNLFSIRFLFSLFSFVCIHHSSPDPIFFDQKNMANRPGLSVSRPLWSNSDDDLIFESQLAREWWWSHTTLWGAWDMKGDPSMEPTSDQPLFLERPSRVPCVFSILNCVLYRCLWAGKFGSFNGCLENEMPYEMPWFCRCSKWQMYCLPTINKLLRLNFTSSINIFLWNPTQPLQIIPVHLPLLPQKKHHIPKVAPPLQMRGEILPLQNRLLAFWADEVPHEVLPPQRGGCEKNECEFSWVMKKDGPVAEMGEEWSGKIWGVQQINIKMMDLFED